jgi:hypothetical protein
VLLVAGDDRRRPEPLDVVDAGDPVLPVVRAAQAEHRVDLVVDDVTGDDGVDRRDVQHGARPDVALTHLDRAQLGSRGR